MRSHSRACRKTCEQYERIWARLPGAPVRAAGRRGRRRGAQVRHRGPRQRRLFAGPVAVPGQSIVPLAEELLPVAAAAVRTVGSLGLKTVFQVIAERAQQCFIGLGMQPPDAVVLVLFFDQAQPAFAGLGSEDRDADVHPLVANEIRGVTEDAVGARSFSRRGSGTQRFDGLFIHGSHPVRKRLAIRSLGLQNQVRHAVAAVQLFGQFRDQPDQLLGDGDNLHRDRG